MFFPRAAGSSHTHIKATAKLHKVGLQSLPEHKNCQQLNISISLAGHVSHGNVICL